MITICIVNYCNVKRGVAKCSSSVRYCMLIIRPSESQATSFFYLSSLRSTFLVFCCSGLLTVSRPAHFSVLSNRVSALDELTNTSNKGHFPHGTWKGHALWSHQFHRNNKKKKNCFYLWKLMSHAKAMYNYVISVCSRVGEHYCRAKQY